MVIVVGLGNKDIQYNNTYHNIGFMVADKLANILSINFSKTVKCKSIIAEGNYNGQKIIIAKPQTYMNNSGEAVVMFKQKYKDAKIIVAVDDIDLPEGKVRFREHGSSGTHNGLRSITHYIGEEFERVKVGIGRDASMDLADYVLSKIRNPEIINKAIDEACNIILEHIC